MPPAAAVAYHHLSPSVGAAGEVGRGCQTNELPRYARTTRVAGGRCALK